MDGLYVRVKSCTPQPVERSWWPSITAWPACCRGLEDPKRLLPRLLSPQFEAIILGTGSAANHGHLLGRPGAPRSIVSLSAPIFSTLPGEVRALEDIAVVGSPADALALGAGEVKLLLPVGLADLDRHCRALIHVALAVEEADRVGLPVMLEPALWGPRIGESIDEVVSHASRVSIELGADMVKVAAPTRQSDVARLIDRAGVSLFLVGGDPKSADALAAEVIRDTRAQAAGIVFGRNIFGRRHPDRAVEGLARLLHRGDAEEGKGLLKASEADR